MLLQFSVENFLSFSHEQVFSMVADQSDPLHPAHLVPGETNKGGKVLRAAAIYGANASGKSNLVQSIQFARQLIVEGVRRSGSLGVRPFRLGDPHERKPSKFEFTFRTEGNLYNYGFRLDSHRIQEEWLHVTLNKKEVMLFERVTSEGDEITVEFGSELKKPKKNEQFLQFIVQGMKPNQLFLTEAAERSVEKLKPVYDWFQSSLMLISAESRAIHLEKRTQVNESFANFLSRLVKSAGTGIEAIDTEEVPLDLENFLLEIPTMEREEWRIFFTKMDQDDFGDVSLPSGRRYLIERNKQGELVYIRMRMRHSGSNRQLVTFMIDEESDGTQRLIHLVPALMMLEESPGKTVIIDELDRRFHPHLSRMLVQIALSCAGNNTQSQLIFTTHDTNLLDLDLLRRDEIWFVEKDQGGASNLYSLAEFKTRPDLKIEKGYLNGRFGAIPVIRDLEIKDMILKNSPEEISQKTLVNGSIDR